MLDIAPLSRVALIDEERMRAFDCAITSMHSPSGEERAVNEWMAQHMRDMGLEALYQPLDETSGNVIGQLRGSGGGPSLWLYAPIDTHLHAEEAEDVPWVGPALRPDMRADSALPGTEPEGCNNFDAFARYWSHHAYAKEDWWHRARLFKPDDIIMQWRMLVAKHARGIQQRGDWAAMDTDESTLNGI